MSASARNNSQEPEKTMTLYPGDMREVLASLKLAGVQFDSCVCDPPYHLTSIVKRFGGENAAPAKHGTDGAFARASAGFMGKQWDGGDIAFQPETWRAVYDVLKPGAHLLAFGGTRTFHRMAVAIEDAGFELRDTMMWLYGSGFPKSHDVSKGIDKAAGATREVVGTNGKSQPSKAGHHGGLQGEYVRGQGRISTPITAPATDAARQWQGWGTALKPAWEPIIVARKPLDGTVAANVLAHGTGALNIDACRVGEGADKAPGGNNGQTKAEALHGGGVRVSPATDYTKGRWPANVLRDGSDEVEAAFAAFGERPGGVWPGQRGKGGDVTTVGMKGQTGLEARRDEAGTASRFFYCAKASKSDRAGSKHPTVKPVSLIRYLVRLVTPPGGVVLDPFAGSGTTGEAAQAEGFNFALIEREAEYQEDIRRRLALPACPPSQPQDDVPALLALMEGTPS